MSQSTPTGVLDRRTLLRAGAASTGVWLSGAAGAPWATAGAARARRTRVYVVVVDGCRPDEVTPQLTPRLAGLRADGCH